MNVEDFEKFYADVGDDAVRTVLAILHLKRDRAEEAVQNAVVYILGRLESYETITPSYFKQLCVNRGRDFLKGEGIQHNLVRPVGGKEREKIALQAKIEHLDGLPKAADAFDPIKWMTEISALLETLPVSFGIAVEPDAARRLLREVLPTPFKVMPDENGSGWTFETEVQFDERGLREAAHRIKGHLSVDPLKMVPGGGTHFCGRRLSWFPSGRRSRQSRSSQRRDRGADVTPWSRFLLPFSPC